MSAPTTVTALRRKVARLEAQLKALHDFLDRDRSAEYLIARREADMRVRVEQVISILRGDE